MLFATGEGGCQIWSEIMAVQFQWGIHYYLVNGELLTGKINTNRYYMVFQPSDWSRALIRVLIYFIHSKCKLQNVEC